MKLIKAPDEFLEKQVKEFDFSTMDPGEISKNMIVLYVIFMIKLSYLLN